jgi:hypothetical protein
MLFLNEKQIYKEMINEIDTLSVKLSKPMALITSSNEFTVGLFGISDDEFVKRYL